MIYLDTTLLNLLKSHAITVKWEMFDPHLKIQHVRLSVKAANKISSIRLWKFNTWFILSGLKNLYEKGGWDKNAFQSTFDCVIDNEMRNNPDSLDDLLPFMSETVKAKYASNIIGRRFDL